MNPSHRSKNSDPKTDALLEAQFSMHIGKIVAEIKPAPITLSRALEHTAVTTGRETRLTSEDIAQRTIHPPVSSFFAMLFTPKPLVFAVLSIVLVVGIAVVALSDESPRSLNSVVSSDRSGSAPTDIPNSIPPDPTGTGTIPTDATSTDSAIGTALAFLTDDLDSFTADDGYDDSLLADDTDIDSLLVTLDSDIDENSF